MNQLDSAESGLLLGDLPFVRLGKAGPPLVIFPGLSDSLWDARAGWSDARAAYGGLATGSTVYVISRKRWLPKGYSTRDMASDYARAIRREIGPTDVLGISLGGHIAQHFAADHPRLVKRLVIASSAHRLSEDGASVPRLWLALARQRRWLHLYYEIAKHTIREYRRTFYQFLLPLLRPGRPDLTGFLVSLEASLEHDGTEALGRIRAPTLVIGGTCDRLFPESLLRETARRISDATLRLIDGIGHGACEERRSTFEASVLEFLRLVPTTPSELSVSPATAPASAPEHPPRLRAG